MEWNKGKLMEISSGFWQSSTIHAGVKLEVFTIIGSDSLNAESVASKAGASLRGMKALLNALTAMGLLNKTDGSFSNTDFSKQFLDKTSPDYTGFIIMHHHHLVHPWSKLDEAVVTGESIRRSVSDTENEIERESFLMGMFNTASASAPVYAKLLDLNDCRHFLDFGGGPGTYAIHFCLNNPEMKATVFDLPTTRKFAEKTIDSFGLSERIRFREGSYLEKRIGLEQEYDAVWLSHILHGESPEDAEGLVKKAVSVLKPGGKILIHEFILNDSMDGPLFPALFSLNMLTGTEKGQAYSDSELRQMLLNSGITEIERIAVNSPNDAGILVGKRP